jgi:hypothetical protein
VPCIPVKRERENQRTTWKERDIAVTLQLSAPSTKDFAFGVGKYWASCHKQAGSSSQPEKVLRCFATNDSSFTGRTQAVGMQGVDEGGEGWKAKAVKVVRGRRLLGDDYGSWDSHYSHNHTNGSRPFNRGKFPSSTTIIAQLCESRKACRSISFLLPTVNDPFRVSILMTTGAPLRVEANPED